MNATQATLRRHLMIMTVAVECVVIPTCALTAFRLAGSDLAISAPLLAVCALEATRIPLSSYATQLKPVAKLVAIAALAGIGLLTAEVMAAGFSALLDGRLAPVFDARDARDAAQRALDDSHGRIDRLTAEAAAARASLTQLSSHPPVLAEVRSQTCLGRRGRSYDCTPSAALRGNASAQASYDSRLKQAQEAVGEAERHLQADPGLKADEEAVRASETRLRAAIAANPMARLVSGLSDATIDRVKSIVAVSLGFAVAFTTSLLAFLAHLQPRSEAPSKLARAIRAMVAAKRKTIRRLKETVGSNIETAQRSCICRWIQSQAASLILTLGTRHDRRTARFLTCRFLPALAAQSGIFARSVATYPRRRCGRMCDHRLRLDRDA